MSVTDISSETRKFLETTSIRGVPRIVKSKSKVMFLIWLVVVLACASVLVWQLTLVFIKYSKYQVNTMFLQAPDNERPTFPDITVCNLCPLVHEDETTVKYRVYFNTINRRLLSSQTIHRHFKNEFGKDNSASWYSYASFLLTSPSFYFNNFPISEIIRVKSNAPTLDCHFTSWDYTESIGNCIENVISIWNSDYYKCYKFELDKLNRNKVRGFSAIFYVNKYLESQIKHFNYGIVNSQATGLKAAVHAPGTAPSMREGMNINPGSETFITIRHTQLSHLPQPYSDCTIQQTIGTVDNVTAYSKDYCLDVCLQKFYVDKCGCIWGQRQYTQLQLKATNNTVCGNLSITREDSNISWPGFMKFLCALKVLDREDDHQSECHAECPKPCLTYEYSTSISSSSWPHISSQLSFYKSFISKRKDRFGSTYDGYEKLLKMNTSLNNSNEIEFLQRLDSQGLISKNFLQLNVIFDSETFDIRKDVAAIPVEALGAQIGGVLSLWLGVTIMFIAELLEFLFTLIGVCYQSKKNSSDASVQPSTQIQVKSKNNTTKF